MKNKTFEARRPPNPDEWDDTGVAYAVNVDDGFINMEQPSQRFGKDALTAMSPDDARWCARQLLEAAIVAERHERNRTNEPCRTSIAAPPGRCLFGHEGCITHPNRKGQQARSS